MRWTLLFFLLFFWFFLAYFVIYHPKSPLPDQWNPVAPLALDHPPSPLTAWKLERALHADQSCKALLSDAQVMAEFQDDFVASPFCHIKGRVAVSGVGQARVDEVSTRCAIAARLALWEKHGLQPAAQRIFGEGIQQIHHLSSYNCRPMRTGRGISLRMSTHATADAIDISGFTLMSGRKIDLLSDWDGDDAAAAAFLRLARDTACDWFKLTLGPDYNDLHANHFHLQSVGSGLCR